MWKCSIFEFVLERNKGLPECVSKKKKSDSCEDIEVLKTRE